MSATGLFGAEDLAEVEATLDGYLTGEARADRWLIDDTGADVAAVAYFAPERMSRGTWNLYMLAVHSAHQREGRGARLILRVEQELREASARVLLIETSGVPDFAGQRSFYLGLGYRQEARIAEFYDVDDDKVVFWKGLVHADRPADNRTPASPGSQTGLHLRVAVVGDGPGLLRLAEAFYREEAFGTSSPQLRRNLDVLLASDTAHVVIAEQGSGAVGLAITTTSFGLENGLIAELEDLYVDPGSRRRGYADALIDDAVAWARDRGCSHLEIVTAPNGRDIGPLQAYYGAHGFLDEGRQLQTRSL